MVAYRYAFPPQSNVEDKQLREQCDASQVNQQKRRVHDHNDQTSIRLEPVVYSLDDTPSVSVTILHKVSNDQPTER